MIPVAKPWLTDKEEIAAASVIKSGWVIQGPKVQEFEKNFANYVGSKYAVAVSSGTAALHLSLVAEGIKENDEVICPSLSYIATANVIKYVGAVPVFVDVDEETMNMSLSATESLISEKTRAIILVHQVGLPADIEGFMLLAEKYGLKIIEDAACAIGSEWRRGKIGGSGNLSCFSFHPRKIITTGDGGMVCLNDEEKAHRLMRLRQHGMASSASSRHLSKSKKSDEHLELGYNYRMTDIQAAVGIEQLKKLDEIVQGRREIAQYYKSELNKIQGISFPTVIAGAMTNYQTFIVKLADSFPRSIDGLIASLGKQGVSARKGIMTAHREQAYLDMGYDQVLPISEKWSDNSVSLPLYYPMEKFDFEKVISAFKSSMNSNSE